jgi:lipoate-protein ligase A
MKFFERLDLYHDNGSQSAATNMAIDEALLITAKLPSIRFYRWKSPALSFGYFGRFADVAEYAAERDLVRRWTGGGIVFHGDDLTYSIIMPSTEPAFGESPMAIYEKIHRALADALAETGQRAVVAAIGDRGSLRSAIGTGVTDPGYSSHCFANPVQADVIIDARKVAGAAQRRTRAGLLHQGSIQGVNFGNGLPERFAKELSKNCGEKKIDNELLDRAREIAGKKYATQDWLQRR